MSDPAVEAMHRAVYTPGIDSITLISDHMVAAAREALKPIRKLHRPGEIGGVFGCIAGCSEGWPCATAQWVYTTGELNRA